jgi:hypothetical protein
VGILDQKVELDLPSTVAHFSSPVERAALLGIAAPQQSARSRKGLDPGEMVSPFALIRDRCGDGQGFNPSGCSALADTP